MTWDVQSCLNSIPAYSSVHGVLDSVDMNLSELCEIVKDREAFSDFQTKLSPTDFSLIAIDAAESLQSCPTLCDPTDGSPPGFSVPAILQARTLEWVAISFSNA